MTPQEMAIVLKLFQVNWKMELDEYAPHVWAEACDGVDGQDAVTAAKRLLKSETFTPTIARFLEECKLVARNRQQRIEPGEREGVLSRDRSAAFAAALGRGLKAAGDLIPKHDHHVKPGKKRADWRDCPACSTADARRPAVEAAIRAEFNAERDA